MSLLGQAARFHIFVFGADRVRHFIQLATEILIFKTKHVANTRFMTEVMSSFIQSYNNKWVEIRDIPQKRDFFFLRNYNTKLLF